LGQGADVRRRSLGYLKKELEIDYHQVPIATLYNRYGTDPVKVNNIIFQKNTIETFMRKYLILNGYIEFQGLPDDQRIRNQEMYGKNLLTPPEKEALIITFLKTLVGGFQLLLWAGSFLSFAAYVAQSFQMDNPPLDNVKYEFRKSAN